MAERKEKWYKSPAFVGLVLTIAGFGGFVLVAKFVSEWILGK